MFWIYLTKNPRQIDLKSASTWLKIKFQKYVTQISFFKNLRKPFISRINIKFDNLKAVTL